MGELKLGTVLSSRCQLTGSETAHTIEMGIVSCVYRNTHFVFPFQGVGSVSFCSESHMRKFRMIDVISVILIFGVRASRCVFFSP